MKNKTEKLVRFAGHHCMILAEQYASNGHTALSLYDAKTSEYVATASSNMPDVPLSRMSPPINLLSLSADHMGRCNLASFVRSQRSLGCIGYRSALDLPSQLKKTQEWAASYPKTCLIASATV